LSVGTVHHGGIIEKARPIGLGLGLFEIINNDFNNLFNLMMIGPTLSIFVI
jgi:hypothetical protein